MSQLIEAINTSDAQLIGHEISLLSTDEITNLKVEGMDVSLLSYCVMQNEITPISIAVENGIPVEDLIHDDERSPLLLAMEIGERATIRKLMRLGMSPPAASDMEASEVAEPIKMFVQNEKYANMMKKKMTELSNVPARPKMTL